MYLRTPKRYTKGHRRSIISLRRIWLWIVTPVIIFAGWKVYQARDTLGPPIQDFVIEAVDSAQNTLSTAIAPTPRPTENPIEAIRVADAAWQRGAIEDALGQYQDILDQAPNNVTVHYRVALGLIMDGRLDEALQAAERTVTANPFSADAWAIRAMALDWNGRPGAAIASALHALELEPENPRALAFLAEAYLDVNQPDRALETVERALENDPDSFEAYRVRGLIRWQAQFDIERAREDFETAYAIAPNMPYIAIDLATMDHSLGNYEVAIETLTEVIEFNPENTQALYNLGTYYYSALGDPNRAADVLNRCVDVRPDSVLCNYYLGRVQVGLDQSSLAAQSLKAAIELGTDNPVHYWWAGQAYIRLGDCPTALPYLQTGMALAQEQGNDDLIDDFEFSLGECQAFQSVPQGTPTPAPEDEAEA